MWCFLVHWLTPLLCCCMDLFPKVCRIISIAAPDVVSFKADDNLKPGEVEWANYIRVRLLLLYCCGDALSDTCVIQSMCGVRTSGSCTYVFMYVHIHARRQTITGRCCSSREGHHLRTIPFSFPTLLVYIPVPCSPLDLLLNPGVSASPITPLSSGFPFL